MADQQEVMPGEWREVFERGTLFTNDVRTCIAVSIYDTDQQMGFLGHFDPESFTNGVFSEMDLVAAALIVDPRSARLWAGGAEVVDENTAIKDIKYDREDIEILNAETQKFANIVISTLGRWARKGSSLSTTWLFQPGYLNYHLDVASGEESVTVYPDQP